MLDWLTKPNQSHQTAPDLTRPHERPPRTMPPKPTFGFNFGPYLCDWSEAFVLTPLSLCLVNYKPIVPGHVLVIPRRVVPRFQDLTPAEVSDLWATAQHVAPIVRGCFGGEALTFAVQDGPAAGQTVAHTHIHILPRKPGDFKKNDDVYDELDKADMKRPTLPAVDADEDRKPRTKEQMAEESSTLRKLFADFSLDIPSTSEKT